MLMRRLSRCAAAGAPRTRQFFTAGEAPQAELPSRIERYGPILATEQGESMQKTGKKRHWTDEPVPAGAVPPTSPLEGYEPRAAHTTRALDSCTSRFAPTCPSCRLPTLFPGGRSEKPRVQCTVLPSGLRVVSQENYGQVATFAMFIDAGSMYEAADELGTCHFLETCAFKATVTRSGDDILALCQAHGISASAVFNREVLMYKVDALRTGMPAALDLLADAIVSPRFDAALVDEARTVIAYQRDEALSQPQVLVSEHLYAAAYGQDTPLGRKEKADDAAIGLIAPSILSRYHSRYFAAPRMVLSAVGVDHATAVALAKTAFRDLRAVAAPGGQTARPMVSYVGGDARSSPDWSSAPATVAASAAASKTHYTHVMLAFPTIGWSHDDVVPVCVVDTLLGGGSSFSAGGPGKGMYSRLYREVLNQFSWVESANAFSTQLYDCGLVGIYGSSPPEHALDLSTVIASHLVRLAEAPLQEGELRRARNQLASSVLMNLETRGLLAEDIGRQILNHGKRLEVEELTRRILAVSPADIMRVMRAAIAHPPSFAAVGDASAIPEYEAFRDFFASAAARHKTEATAGSGIARIRT
jgi:processing peptidase subunit alpha